MPSYTPGPWRLGKNPQWIIVGRDSILQTHSMVCGEDIAEANAAFIVRACNSFADLLAALESLKHNNEDCWCDCAIDNPMMHGKHSAACIQARAAIAKARGES